MTNPAFTFIIPHYGDPEPTRALVSRLEGDPAASGLPVIVVDDHSPEPLTLDTDRATVIRQEANGGFGTTVNTGLRAAQTPFVLVLNSDLDLPEGFLPDFLEAAAAEMPAVISPEVAYEDGRSQWVGRHLPTVGHQVVEWLIPLARWRDRPRLHEAVGHDTRCHPPHRVEPDWVFGACMALPREEALSIGGFDEQFFMNAEEVDLQRRLREQGVPSVYRGDFTVTHASGGSSNSGLRRRWLVASRMKYARKWGHERRLRLGLRAATLVNFAFLGLKRAAGRDVSPVATLREEWALTSLNERGANSA